MTTDLHGIISAYRDSPELGVLVQGRTASALTFAGRYRLVDFALSSMRLAGVRNVGVIMQKEYQSLMDHIGSGKDWDFSRKSGGISLLPPFSLDAARSGEYSGLLEALLSAESYLKRIQENYVVIMPGNMAFNLDLKAALAEHIASGAGITAVCFDGIPNGEHHRFVMDEEGNVTSQTTPKLVAADVVFIAVSQVPKDKIASTTTGLELNEWGLIKVNEDFMTSKPGVFSAGDVVLGAKTVVAAARDAKIAAEGMAKYLQSK